MKKKVGCLLFVIGLFGLVQSFVYGVDDQVVREETKENVALKSVKGVASGVKEVGRGPGKLISETVKETASGPPVLGTVQGVQKGSAGLVDSTVKGAYKVATLGYGNAEQVELEEPERKPDSFDHGYDHPNDKPARFKIKIPGS